MPVLWMTASVVAGDRPGLVSEEPADGPAVRTDSGWMVPYDMPVEGTNVTFRMIPVPGGEFVMGSPDTEPGRNADEGPQRTVRIQPFWMAECEVTWAEYKLFMQLYRHLKEFESRRIRLVSDANRVDAVTAPTPLYEPDFTFEYGEDPQQPAVSMTQYAARQYAKWISLVSGLQYRLPTEAEWEYACRAGSATAYCFGDDPAQLGDYAWFADNTEGAGTKRVRQKRPNAFGLYDMHGNAAEWVMDCYDSYPASDGPWTGTDWVKTGKPYPRVVRGGSWEFTAAQCRSAARLGSDDKAWKEFDPNRPCSPWWFTSDPARGVGFRLVRSLAEVPRDVMEDFWAIDSEDIQFDVMDRLNEGRGVLGLVDKDLPEAIRQLEK